MWMGADDHGRDIISCTVEGVRVDMWQRTKLS